MSDSTSRHIPILVGPILDFFRESPCLKDSALPSGVFIDCTFGGGGHSRQLLDLLKDTSHRLIGIDRDPEAIERAKKNFQAEISTGKLELASFSFSRCLEAVKDRPIYGLLADLGMSSDQIDSQTRGFSFRFPGVLDMRMNPTEGQSLHDWLRQVSEKDLADVLWQYGEERASRRIAKRLIQLRDSNAFPANAQELAEAIASTFPPSIRYQKIHPATRSFQAFRIFLNQELEELDTLIDMVLPAVSPGGRIAILSFHSLEDRRVKHSLRNQALYDLPRRKSIKPSDEEVETNPRSRSTRLRLAIRQFHD